MHEELVVSSCIACGRLDRHADCTGDCRDRRHDLADRADAERVSDALAAMRESRAVLGEVAAALAATGDAGDARERYTELQRRARLALRAAPPAGDGPAGRVARITAWRCETCGRVESPQPCLGVCVKRDRPMVPAADVDAQQDALDALGTEVGALRALLGQLAHATPKDGEWEASLGALRRRGLSRGPGR